METMKPEPLDAQAQTLLNEALTYAEENRNLLIHIAKVNGAVSPEDAVQEALFVLYRSAAKLRPETIPALVRRTVQRKGIDNWRYHNRRSTVPLDSQINKPSRDPGPETQALHIIALDELHKTLDELPSFQQEVVNEIVFEEKSLPETAESLNLPIGTVKSRFHRAKKTLIQAFEQPLKVTRQHGEVDEGDGNEVFPRR